MIYPFEHFDFELLDDPDFREDSIREELVSPLLKALGYSASPPHRIIRSRPLQHPYVYIGTVKKTITIIPDYLLQRNNKNAWILDAKGPRENIDSGKNVEQVYSYAIHKDIRVPLYALCNGHRLLVYNVSSWPSVLDVSLQTISKEWPKLLDILGTRAAWPNGIRPGFLPDLGLALRKAGLAYDKDGKKYFQIFTSVPVQMITKLEDNLYSITGAYEQEESAAHMITFDFATTPYQKLLSVLSPEIRDLICSGLSRQPYRVFLNEDCTPLITVYAELGDEVYKNENESYCPFIAEDFIEEPAWD